MRKIDEAYKFIKDYITEKDYPPTIREIGEAIDIKSTSTISYYLRKLEESNKIVKGSYKNRSIQLIENISTKNNSDIISLPLIDHISEGKPLMSEQNISDKFMLSSSLFKGLDMFLVPINDNSMKDSNIIKGDILVVSRQKAAQNGELVVAVVGSGYMVARLFREFDLYKLQLDNKDYDPVYVERLMIMGKVVGVIRNNVN